MPLVKAAMPDAVTVSLLVPLPVTSAESVPAQADPGRFKS